MARINFLPPWVETNLQPAFYDLESGTCLQQTARMYDKVNQLVRSVNEQNETIADYIQQFIDLKDYCEDYFANLDVQEEIDHKLDQMADSGELGELMSAYILPIQQAYEARVDNRLDEQDSRISNIDDKVESATNGSPIPVSSTDDMTDTDRIYVLVSTGKWYYYDGDSWEIGGDYQTPVASFDPTLTESDGIPDSKAVGARINQSYYLKNVVDVTDVQLDKTYNSSGEIIDLTGGVIYNTVIALNNGDRLHCQYNTGTTITGKAIAKLVEVDAYGNFIRYIGAFGVSEYTSNTKQFVRLVVNLQEGQVYTNVFAFVNMLPDDYLDANYTDKNAEDIKEINRDIDLNSTQYNYLDTTKCVINQNLDGNATLVYSSNGFFITNPVKIKNGDVVRFYNFSNTSGIYALQALTYDENKQFISRSNVSQDRFTASADGYVVFNCVKPTSLSELGDLDITVNREISSHYPYGRIFTQSADKKVRVQKVNNNEFTIYFGNFNMTLFKTVDAGSNSNNWNLKVIKRGDNVLVPAGTDFIGPVRINANTDFIGGVHGDETTTSIILNLDGTIYKNDNIQNISDAKCNKLSITLISDVYDQLAGDLAFTRNVVIDITDNKMHCSNSYRAKKNLTLKTACVGGLIACQNPIIKNITMNTVYYDTAPNTYQVNHSKYNNVAVIDTNYGSIQINNIKGYTEPNYIGFMHVYTNESPMRCKVYFDTYYEGNFPISTNDIISGEFEYLFN